jgi:hypothetical protein
MLNDVPLYQRDMLLQDGGLNPGALRNITIRHVWGNASRWDCIGLNTCTVTHYRERVLVTGWRCIGLSNCTVTH